MSRVPYPHRTHHAQAMQLMTQKHTLTSTLTQLGGGASAARCSTSSRTSCSGRVRKTEKTRTTSTHVDAHGIPPSQNLVLRIHELGGCGLRGGVINIHGGRCGRRRGKRTSSFASVFLCFLDLRRSTFCHPSPFSSSSDTFALLLACGGLASSGGEDSACARFMLSTVRLATG